MARLDTEGYGVSPRAARTRAATVRAVTASPATPARPLLWVAICGGVAVVSLVYLVHALAGYGTGSMAGVDATFRFVLFGALYGFGVWGFCYGWELYDTRKAARLAIILGVFGLAILIVAALVLVLLAKAGDDLDVDLADLGRGAGSAARGAGAVARAGGAMTLDAAEAVAPLVAQAYSESVPAPWDRRDGRETNASGHVSSLAPSPAPALDRPTPLPASDPQGVDCARCGHRFDPRDRLGCPACGHPI